MRFRRTRYGFITALLMSVALVLAGCGGDDGVSQSVHDQALEAQAAAEQKAAEEAAAARGGSGSG